MQKAGIKTSEFWGLVAGGAAAAQYAPEPWNYVVPGILAGLWGILRTLVKARIVRGTVGDVVGRLEGPAGQ